MHSQRGPLARAWVQASETPQKQGFGALGEPSQKKCVDRELVHIQARRISLHFPPEARSSGSGEVVQKNRRTAEERTMYRIIAITISTFLCIALPYMALQMVGM
jgi:hypothetical protein